MRIMFNLDEDDNCKLPTNFRVAEAIINLCNHDDRIDAEAVAKMILVQVETNKEKNNG